MKRNLQIAVLVVIGMITTAQVKGSELNLRSTDNSLIAVAIDNGALTLPATNVSVKYIPEGYHLFTVYRVFQMGHCGNGNNQLLFNQMVYMPKAVDMNAIVNQCGVFKIKAIVPHQVAVVCYNQGTNNFNNYNNNYNGYGNSGNYNSNNYTNNCLNANDFAALRATIQNQNFDDTRLTIAKQALQNRMLSANQVAELVSLFTFESNKLDFAKYAYQSTYDKDRYFIINNEFTFSSSIDDLNNYINRV